MEEKSKVREAIDSIKKIGDAIIFLKNELFGEEPARPRLYTEEEMRALYNIKKDLDRYPKR